MSEEKSLTSEEIFAQMHRELRSWNRDIPESPDRLDPILKILMQLHSYQLARLDKRLDFVWDKAKESLIRTVCPESMRWPVPAITVMSCQPEDPVVEVDPHTRFFYKEQRQKGQTFFFSSLKKEKILSARVKYMFLQSGENFYDLKEYSEGGTETTGMTKMMPGPGGKCFLFVAVDYDGSISNFKDAVLFLKGDPDALKQMQWGYWYPGSNFGSFHEDSGFCPGLDNTLEKMFTLDGQPAEWGGLRTVGELFTPLANSFVSFPENFVSTWEVGPPDEKLLTYLTTRGHPLSSESGNLFWLRIDLPEGGRKNVFLSKLELFFNCFIIANKNELTIFKHTGGYKLVEIELPDDIKNILEITRVVDSNGREYQLRHKISDRAQGVYSLEERNEKLVLWFDFSTDIDRPPDSINVHYAVTAGVSANGIEVGKITELYESHPGIVEAATVMPTGGAVPARSREQISAEVAARLRNRDRALSFTEVSKWTKAFDPRIKRVECANGIERAERGVRRCIVVQVSVNGEQFYSDDETDVLRKRLAVFLKSRVPVNTHFKIEIMKK